MKDTFYFTHDYNARQDFKIKKLHRKHGSLGYGVFWSLVEDLYNNANALPLDYDSMAYEYKTDSDLVKSVIHDFELFTFSGTEFGSLSVQKRLDERALKSKKARDSAQKRWSNNIDNQPNDANALPTESESNAIKKERKETKERKKYINKPKKKSTKIEFTKTEFQNMLIPFLEKYKKELIREFFDYWTETNINNGKMRYEGEKYFSISRRLATWHKNSLNSFSSISNNNSNGTSISTNQKLM